MLAPVDAAGGAILKTYEAGKAVFVIAESGLMFDVSLGGQKFNYMPEYLVED